MSHPGSTPDLDAKKRSLALEIETISNSAHIAKRSLILLVIILTIFAPAGLMVSKFLSSLAGSPIKGMLVDVSAVVFAENGKAAKVTGNDVLILPHWAEGAITQTFRIGDGVTCSCVSDLRFHTPVPLNGVTMISVSAEDIRTARCCPGWNIGSRFIGPSFMATLVIALGLVIWRAIAETYLGFRGGVGFEPFWKRRRLYAEAERLGFHVP